MKIKVGDKVMVIAGKDRGKSSTVTRAIKNEYKEQVVVEGVNKVKKHIKATEKQKGGIIEFEKPINVSNVMIICPHCNKITRVGYNNLHGKDKKRICKKCTKVLLTESPKK